jgi:epsilon-lactone hydrolase
MPSLKARLFSFVLRSTGILRRQFAGGEGFLTTIEKGQSQKAAVPKAHTSDITRSDYLGRTVWTIKPKSSKTTAEILYWHGGGYVFPISSAHWAFLCRMADTYGWAITVPLYPLAPAFRGKDITQWALDFYRDYTVTHSHFFMGGDSAGGGLTAATAQSARNAGLPPAAGLILICPWLNANPDHTDQPAIEPRDAILTLRGIEDCGKLYAADLAIDDPRVSPIFGNWDQLPPILCFGGGADILVTDARALKDKRPDIMYEELADMIHIWPILPFTESRVAQRKMADFANSIQPAA